MPADREKSKRVAYILGDPDLYPDEFKSWLPRVIEQNPNLRLSALQIPQAEAVHYVGTSNQPAFENGWVNYAAGYEEAGFWIDPWDVVHLVGLIKNGTIGARAFLLPGGYRPKGRQIFSNVAGADTGFRVDVTATGDVLPMSGTNGYVSLSGITFRAFG